MRFCRLLMACLIPLLTLTGCWNRIELNQLGITTATGIDWDNGEWVVTFQEIVPSAMSAAAGGTTGGNIAQSPVHVFSTRAKTIREAVAVNDFEHSRWIYLAHNNVVVVGREAAKHGIGSILDAYFRNHDARQSTEIVVTDRDARLILEQLVPPERLPGDAIASILRKEDRSSSAIPAVSVFDAALMLTSETGTAMLPEISLSGEETERSKSLDAFKTSSQSSKLKLTRIAVFRGDTLAGWLSREEGLGVSWMSGKVKNTTFTFTCPSGEDESLLATYRSYKASAKVTPIRTRDGYSFRVKVKTSGELLNYGCMPDITRLGTVRAIEKQVEAKIREDVKNGWAAMQRLRADLAGLAGKVHRKYPRDWRKVKDTWNERLAEMEVDVQTDVKIRRQGLTANSFQRILK
ncbi:Ger(x)C family spore germination protein [Cohnella candidum]|uniref:Ger(X)C family spore germination protein n=1 Tax=Cohnella candidum TaxID=2674991 RepID=A0A3G3JVM4_9BACL|nr:Ger(x)C family spore germination protein [Cohnella candidum]AYQ72285.1 Ger(x)C family spore germination protein [Cohnella candidum]